MPNKVMTKYNQKTALPFVIKFCAKTKYVFNKIPQSIVMSKRENNSKFTFTTKTKEKLAIKLR